jgi:hypothetical protein
MHRVIHGLRGRAVADAWYAEMQEELAEMLYEPHSSILLENFSEYDREYARAQDVVHEWVSGYAKIADIENRKDFVIQAQKEIPEYWQLAITEQFSNKEPDYKLFVVKKITGKNPRAWSLPTTDDVAPE